MVDGRADGVIPTSSVLIVHKDTVRVPKVTKYHVSVFIITFFGYAFYHATRKTFSNVKNTLAEEWSPTYYNHSIAEVYPNQTWNRSHLFATPKDAMLLLGILDALFLISYAAGLYISGILGDRFDHRKVLSYGMIASAICVLMFGCVSEWCNIQNVGWYVFWWTLGGFLQASGWPNMVAVMANWFGKSSRGLVLGLWSACASVGNIIGSLMAGAVIDYGYEYAFLLPSTCLFGGGIIIYFGLVVHPNEVGLPSVDAEENIVIVEPEEDQCPLLFNEDGPESLSDEIGPSVNDNDKLLEDSTDSIKVLKKEASLTFFQAICLPGVIAYSLAYACLKMVNYSFFFWLPYYLTAEFAWTQADSDKLSVWYDVGGIISGTIAGFISDRMGMRAPVVEVMLILALPSLYGYSRSPNSKTYNAILMGVTGFFIGGPSNIISSAISADLGRQTILGSSKQALATVTGIVDGTGSVGGAIGQLLIPVIDKHLGWHFVFYLFMLMTVCTSLCVLPILIKEIRSSGRCCRQRWEQCNETTVN